MHTPVHAHTRLWWLSYNFPSIACVDSVGLHKHANQNLFKGNTKWKNKMQSGLENTCLSLSVCPHCLLAFVPECDAPACCVQDRPLRFIILTGNPTAKCSRASSWKQGVKSCDWWVLCFNPLASQRVSSQGEDAPHNHYLNIFFTKNHLDLI